MMSIVALRPPMSLEQIVNLHGNHLVAWNLDQFAAIVLKGEDKQKLVKLAEENKAKFGPYIVFYLPGKLFSIKLGATYETVVYDLGQYFPNDLEEPENIQVYADKLATAITAMNLESTKTLVSPIGIYKSVVLPHVKLPSWDMPREAMMYAMDCAGRAWIEAFQVGKWEKAWDYDLKGAYPHVAANLYATDQLNWIKSPICETDAIYGYAKGRVIIDKDIPLHPIMKRTDPENTRDDNAVWHSPVGTWHTTLTKGEIDFIIEHGIGEFHITDGWWAFERLNFNTQKPLMKIIPDILRWKKDACPVVRTIAKGISVGMYGIFGAVVKDTYGPHFNPCWFAEIPTQTRLQVAEFIYKHKLQSNLIHVSTDGVLLDSPVELDLEDRTRFEWALDYEGPSLVLGSMHRWLPRLHTMGITMDEIGTEFKKFPNNGSYFFNTKLQASIGQCVQWGEFSHQGEQTDYITEVNLATIPQKRNFPDYPNTGEEVLRKIYRSKARHEAIPIIDLP